MQSVVNRNDQRAEVSSLKARALPSTNVFLQPVGLNKLQSHCTMPHGPALEVQAIARYYVLAFQRVPHDLIDGR